MTAYSRVPNRRVGWNKRVGGKIAGNLINKLDGIKELVGNCTKAKNELVRKFSNFITHCDPKWLERSGNI